MTKLATQDARANAHEATQKTAPQSTNSRASQPLRLKTYQAWTMAEALSFAKQDLGEDAVILHTRTFERGGFFGFGRKAVVEITAARAADMPDARPARQREMVSPHGAPTDPRVAAATRAYGSQIQSASRSADRAAREQLLADGPSALSPVELDMDREREKTKRLAQAMAVQLERQQSTRDVATRNELATERRVAQSAAQAVSQPSANSNATTSLPAPSPLTVTTEPIGPAQRFVLVPEVGSPSGVRATVAAVLHDQTREHSRGTQPEAAVQQLQRAESPEIKQVASNALTSGAVSGVSASTGNASPIPEPSPAKHSAELDAIDAFVRRVLTSQGNTTHSAASSAVAHAFPAARPAVLEEAFARLIEQEVSRELADRIMADVEREVSSASEAEGGFVATRAVVRDAVERRLAALLPSDEIDGFRMSRGRNGRARRIAFVGPTGVGKTTTLAKIAAQLTLKRGLRVGIVAADTYRIAAVDQLRTYAEILGIAVEVASSPADAARACDRLGDVDVVLIDTAGRSQNDRMKLSELKAFLAAAEPDETHLVLSATAGARTLAKEAESFGALGADRLVLTKLDEAASFGTLIGLVERLGTRVSFFTHGQEVPDHIEVAQGRR
ncbi:MAG: hypothetical protein QM516_12120, partial [Limnohabitans sp.]|nr:hypothetical protein [Limnohabitans sp.]